MIYLISYDLKAPNRNYDDLYAILKTAESWWHYLESTWLIYTSDGIEAWQMRIKSAIDNNDSFIIVDVTKQPRNGWLPKKAWEWIQEYENK